MPYAPSEEVEQHIGVPMVNTAMQEIKKQVLQPSMICLTQIQIRDSHIKCK